MMQFLKTPRKKLLGEYVFERYGCEFQIFLVRLVDVFQRVFNSINSEYSV